MAVHLDIVDRETYYSTVPHPATVYDSADFARTVSAAYGTMYILATDEDGNTVGMTWGKDEYGTWNAPFSAPYALCSMSRADMPVSLQTLRAIAGYVDTEAHGKWRMVLPPEFYAPALIHAAAEVFGAQGHELFCDRNYAHPVQSQLTSVARRNLRKAENHGSFALITDADAGAVYDLIAEHHRQLGYEMAMTRDQVLATARTIPMDFFMVMDEDIPAAAAYYQHTAPHIVQMINWGDTAEARPLRVTNWMDHAISLHYATLGISTIDLGPGTHHGIPNEGLERFKTSLGCSISLKHIIAGHAL